MAIQELKQKNKVDGKPEVYAKIYSGVDAMKWRKYYVKNFGTNFKVVRVYEDQFTGSTMALIKKTKPTMVTPFALIYSSGDFSVFKNLKEAMKRFNKMKGDLV